MKGCKRTKEEEEEEEAMETNLTTQTIGMIFLHPIRFQILAFDSAITGLTQRVIEEVIMSFAVWVVINNVKGRSIKGLSTRLAHQAWQSITSLVSILTI